MRHRLILLIRCESKKICKFLSHRKEASVAFHHFCQEKMSRFSYFRCDFRPLTAPCRSPAPTTLTLSPGHRDNSSLLLGPGELPALLKPAAVNGMHHHGLPCERVEKIINLAEFSRHFVGKRDDQGKGELLPTSHSTEIPEKLRA